MDAFHEPVMIKDQNEVLMEIAQINFILLCLFCKVRFPKSHLPFLIRKVNQLPGYFIPEMQNRSIAGQCNAVNCRSNDDS